MKTFAFMAIHPLWREDRANTQGKYNGYVGILEGETGIPDYTDWDLYDLAPKYLIDVHGGVTFDGHLKGNLPIIPLTDNIPANWNEYRVIGFDCSHCDDDAVNCSIDYVKSQTLKMQEQIENHLENPFTGDLSYQTTEEVVEDEHNVISNGLHYLSGIGDATIHDEWNDDDIDVNLFCIDGVTYGAYIDPDDGYRSYGHIGQATGECQFKFEPQPVNVVNKTIKGDPRDCYADDKSMIVITDATNGKEVLVVGTNYADNYYPCAIFHYNPENLEINQNK